MLVMGDGLGGAQATAQATTSPKVDDVMPVTAARVGRQIGWAQHYGAGALLAVCAGQLSLFCTGSVVAGFIGALAGGLIASVAMRWIDTHRSSAPQAVSHAVTVRALEEAERTQREVLQRLRQISQATQDTAYAEAE
jgi:hypothetical protein